MLFRNRFKRFKRVRFTHTGYPLTLIGLDRTIPTQFNCQEKSLVSFQNNLVKPPNTQKRQS